MPAACPSIGCPFVGCPAQSVAEGKQQAADAFFFGEAVMLAAYPYEYGLPPGRQPSGFRHCFQPGDFRLVCPEVALCLCNLFPDSEGQGCGQAVKNGLVRQPCKCPSALQGRTTVQDFSRLPTGAIG